MIEGDRNSDNPKWRINLFASLFLPLLAIAIFIGIEYWGDLRDQDLRKNLVFRGLRANGFVKRFDGRGEHVAVFHFQIPDGRDIETSYDMTGTPERSRIVPATKTSVVYDPSLPEHAIPEPFTKVPPFDIVSDLRFYLFGLGGIYTVFLLPLALFSAWRDRRQT